LLRLCYVYGKRMKSEQGALVEWYWHGETEVLERENLSQNHIVNQESHTDWPVPAGIMSDLQLGILCTDCFISLRNLYIYRANILINFYAAQIIPCHFSPNRLLCKKC
jgi:hypothetical protein